MKTWVNTILPDHWPRLWQEVRLPWCHPTWIILRFLFCASCTNNWNFKLNLAQQTEAEGQQRILRKLWTFCWKQLMNWLVLKKLFANIRTEVWLFKVRKVSGDKLTLTDWVFPGGRREPGCLLWGVMLWADMCPVTSAYELLCDAVGCLSHVSNVCYLCSTKECTVKFALQIFMFLHLSH